jgi:PAS domain S-box-containing protein
MKEYESEEASKGAIPESDAASVLDVIGHVLETGTFDSSHLPKDPVIRKRLEEIAVAIGAVQNFTLCLSTGDLDSRLDVKGISAGCLKALQSNLKHLTWQAQQIAAGDFSQRVDFMGEFSEAFNSMVRALDAARAEMKQHALELSTLNAQLVTEVTVRRQAEETLRLQNQIFETIAEGVYLIRARDGVIVYTNSKFEKMFGYEKGELIGKHVSVVNAPEEKMSPRDTAEEIMKALNEKGEWRGEVKNIRKDGTVFWCLAVVSTFEHPEFGSVWISAHTDITERKQAEEALKRSYSVLHGVVESPKEVVIFALDRQYRYIAFNENHRHTMQQIWGVDIVLGNSMLEYIRRPDDRNKAIINFDRALSGESFTVVEAYGDTALERRWYEDIYNPITDEKGNVIGLTLFLTDITNRKQMEEALRESEEKFREIFENANDAIEIIELLDSGLPGKYIDLNNVACRMVHYTKEELLQHGPREIDTGYFSRPFEEIIKELHTDDHATFEAEHRRKDGIIVPVEVNAHIVTLLGKRVILSIVRDITERKKADAELRRQAEIIDQTHDSIITTDLEGVVTSWNKGAERLYGYTVQESLGRNISFIYPDNEQNVLSSNVIAPLREKGSHEVEVRVRKKTGEILYVHISLSLIKAETGIPTGMIGYSLDITERKKVEEALQESEEKFRGVAERSSDIIMLTDKDGRVTYIAPSVERILGYDPGETVGTRPEDVVHPDDIEAVMELIGKFAAGKTGTENIEVRVRKNDGDYAILDLSISPVIKDGIFSGTQVIGRDISERKQAEEALIESRRMYRELVENINDVILSLDLAGYFTYVSPVIKRLYGYTPEEMIGEHFSKYVHPDDHPPCIEAFKKRLKGEFGLNEFRIVKKDGGTEYVMVSQRAIVKDGEVSGFNYILTNITARKRAEEELRESRQILEAVINTITVRVFWKDKNLVYLGCNTSFARDAGFEKPEDIIGKDDYAMGWREQAELYRGDDRAVIESGKQKLLFEEPQTTPSGEKIYLLTSKVPLQDANGEIIGVLGTYLDITARKKMEDALKESEERYRTILEQATDAVFIHDETGRVIDVNRKACLSLGYSREELLSKTIGDIDPDAIQTEKDKLWGKVIAGEHFTFESHQRRKDGGAIPVEVSLGSVHLPDRRVIIGTVRDITERKKAEAEERLTRERFETLVKVSEMRDASETKLSEYVMEAACRMTGSTLAFIGTMTPDESVMDIVAWSSSAMQDCRVAVSPIHFPVQKAGIWADAIRTRKPKIVNDYSAPHPGKKGLPEGHVRITRFLSLPILDNGKVVMVAAVANKPDEYDDTDVTRMTLLMEGVWGNLQRRRSEEALKKREEQYRVLFDESPISLWEEDFSDIKVWIDTKMNEGIRDLRTWLESHPEDVAGCAIMVNVLHINRATMALFGAVSLKEFSEGLSRIFIETSYDVFREEIIALAEGKNEFEGEVQIQTLNGERKIVLLKMMVVPGYEQTLSKILVSIIDISDLKRIDEALRQANRQLNLLSSITRHDILNQLMALKGYLELSQDVIDNPETLSGYIKKEQQAANTIEHQITFTKDYQDLGVTAPAWQNVNAGIKKAVAGLPMRDVHVDTDRTDLEIFADRLFEKVFYNLIDNALKYGGDRMTTIRISSEESDQGCTIVCEDDGVGITDEDKKKLFRKGFGKHTGLGLFLSREILAITGITITENGTPGKGARFEITVPKGMWRMKGVDT